VKQYFATAFYEKVSEIPVVVRTGPSTTERVAGIVHGGRDIVLQAHGPTDERTDADGFKWVSSGCDDSFFYVANINHSTTTLTHDRSYQYCFLPDVPTLLTSTTQQHHSLTVAHIRAASCHALVLSQIRRVL
jgi:hypothetical protein